MDIKNTIKVEQETIVTDIICDCCGKSCKVNETMINKIPHRDFEFMKLESYWGYHSGKDTEKWTAHICEKCVDEKLSFIKFNKENYI